jgi:hypothetical protein
MSAAGRTLDQADAGAASNRWRLIGGLLLMALLVVLGIHVFGVFSDFATAIHYPFELDYGEGIVWQQAELIPGPRMYSTSTDLPFIVFHYPPLYHLLVRAMRLIQPDWLAAGRLVAGVSTIPIALCVAGLVLVATARRGAARSPMEIGIAIATGALVLCLHAVRAWGMYMRVDLPATALAMMGLLVASLAVGRFWGTTAALLLCGVAVFTKQTELPAGIAVFLIALVRNPRAALGAAAIAGGVCVAALVFLEMRTDGGFMLNIIRYNMNPMSLEYAKAALWPERPSFPFIILAPVAAWFVCRLGLPAIAVVAPRAAWGQVRELRRAERPLLCRTLMLLNFVLLSPMLLTLLKHGSNFNYFLDWFAAACVLVGIALVDLWRARSTGQWVFVLALTVLILTVGWQPVRLVSGNIASRVPWQQSVVGRIREADKPVASEDMVLLMRAGKPVIFEPDNASDLSVAGVWDPAKLLQFIRSHGFAFMITRDDIHGRSLFRSADIDAAMREAYPRIEQVGPRLWLHLPPA